MTITLEGSDNPVQRVIRRTYEVMKKLDPKIDFLGNDGLPVLIKALSISMLEELANYNTPQVNILQQGILELDMDTQSTLSPVPGDK